MNLTEQEAKDIRQAFRNNIEETDFVNNEAWYNNWAMTLVRMRREYQIRFLSEAYNEHSPST